MKNYIFYCLLILFSSNVLSAVATITSPTSSAVGTTSAALGGNVTNDGAEIILEHGVAYAVASVNANPQLGGVGVTSLAAYNLVTLSPAPQNMTSYGANSGQVYRMSLTGSTSGGTVWGTGTYTDDSNLAMAAVHAGVLANGVTGNVHIKVTAGSSSYTASTSNGVTSLIYGPWPRNYEFVSSGPTGVFTKAVTGLTPNTTYAYVAYVTNSSGTTYSPVSTFTTNSLAPTVSAISPSTGSTLGGTTVTITGTDLTGATAITVGGAACTNVIVASATSATCTTPAGTAGSASLLVTTSGGTNAANTLFTYVTPVATPVPTLSEWAMIFLASLMGMFAFARIRRQS
jgi:hypothetical protein